MELPLLRFGQQQGRLSSPLSSLYRLSLIPSSTKGPLRKRKPPSLPCCCSENLSAGRPADSRIVSSGAPPLDGRRWFVGLFIAAASGLNICDIAYAVSTSRRALRGAKVPESDFTTLPNGLKYYDLKVGGGPKAVKGSRVAVHYVAKWKGVTFMTSRQGLGVTGGTPYGFDVGQSERGTVLKGLDLGVQGMRVGGQRLLIVPPELAYGRKGVQEIPPNATIELDVELLAIKQSPFGSSVKLVEGVEEMGAAVTLVLVAQVLLVGLVRSTQGQGLVPGVMIFGDSVVDAGNNNNLVTIVKANFPPYGRDFAQQLPTGRFCNGKLATDFIVENLGFTSYPPAYLSGQAAGDGLLTGANFASAASGYLDRTANLYRAVSLTQQMEYYREYQSKLAGVAGRSNATAVVAGSIHILSAGSSDYVQNYYINPLLNKVYTPDQFADLLVQSFTSFVQNLYGLGARRIGVTSLPPIGCLPASITLFGGGGNDCVTRLNDDAAAFNKKITNAAQSMKKTHRGLKLVVFDIFNPLLDLIKHPANSGFFEARRACCGTGTIETSLLCNARSPGTCANATGYVFWDSFHPSEAANKVLADALLLQGIDLIS